MFDLFYEILAEDDIGKQEELQEQLSENSLADAINYGLYSLYRREPSDFFPTLKVLLQHPKSSKYTEMFVADPDVWTEYLKYAYNIEIDSNDKRNREYLVRIYNTLKTADLLINDYRKLTINDRGKIHTEYKSTRDKLGHLYKNNNIYEFKCLVRIGAPITYKSGEPLCNAVKIYELNALELIDTDRLTYFMNDNTRAWNLVKTMAELRWSHAEPLFNYLLNNDNGIRPDIYRKLITEYSNHKDLVNYINTRVKL